MGSLGVAGLSGRSVLSDLRDAAAAAMVPPRPGPTGDPHTREGKAGGTANAFLALLENEFQYCGPPQPTDCCGGATV